jgi:serine/threonine-protein kinase HipA
VSALDIWMNGEYVGRWTSKPSHTLQYTREWMASPLGRPLSLSLPFTADGVVKGATVANYFDNLLPDNEAIRKRIRARYGAKSLEAIELLTAIGRDCVGAVQLLPVGEKPEGFDTVQYERLRTSDIEAILRDIPVLPAFARPEEDREFRISIAGAQEKTALLRVPRVGWCRPLGATPTTHILKLPLGKIGGRYDLDLTTSIENEWLCLKILGAMGLDVAEAQIGVFGDQKALVVERFDREWVTEPGENARRWIRRLPQEDLCQASGLPPGAKYESNGGPGIAKCLDILGGSSAAAYDRTHFALTQLAFWLLAATDGHAKNFSLFIARGGEYQATPIYDVISAWPYIGRGAKMMPRQDAKLAMALRSKRAHYQIDSIHPRHWKALGEQAGGQNVWGEMLSQVLLAGESMDEVERMLPDNFPPHVWNTVNDGVRKQAQTFLAGAEAMGEI